MSDVKRYYASWERDQKEGICEEYSCLYGPDGEVCILTEPEDRIWSRDLAPLVGLLNALDAKLTAAEARAERAEQRDHERTLYGRGAPRE